MHEAGGFNDKLEVTEAIKPFLETIKKSFEILNLHYNWSENPLEIIDIALVENREPFEVNDPNDVENNANVVPPGQANDQNEMSDDEREQERQRLAQLNLDPNNQNQGLNPDLQNQNPNPNDPNQNLDPDLPND